MFTVKHIDSTGEEKIFEAETVRFTPGIPATQVTSECPPTLWVLDVKGICDRPVTGGTIFVMNENGKTVARYDLGVSPVPIVGDGLSDPRPKGLAESNCKPYGGDARTIQQNY